MGRIEIQEAPSYNWNLTHGPYYGLYRMERGKDAFLVAVAAVETLDKPSTPLSQSTLFEAPPGTLDQELGGYGAISNKVSGSEFA